MAEPLTLDVTVQSSRFHETAAASLSVRGLTLAVGAARRELLRDADLQLCRGRRYALLGRNGCGKSLLLQVLASGAIFDPDTQLRLRVLELLVGGGAGRGGRRAGGGGRDGHVALVEEAQGAANVASTEQSNSE